MLPASPSVRPPAVRNKISRRSCGLICDPRTATAGFAGLHPPTGALKSDGTLAWDSAPWCGQGKAGRPGVGTPRVKSRSASAGEYGHDLPYFRRMRGAGAVDGVLNPEQGGLLPSTNRRAPGHRLTVKQADLDQFRVA